MPSSAKKLRAARDHLAQFLELRRSLPKRVEVQDLNERAVVKLATERKHLTDIITMVAYQAESDLLALLRPHYARVEQEGRTLLHELFAMAGNIQVSDTELRITLVPLSSPHRTRRSGSLRDPRSNSNHLPRLSPAHALHRASATAYRARIPWLAGRAKYRHRSLIGA
jgi:hypothetical protein